MAASWQTDVDAAYAQALTWTGNVQAAKDWPDTTIRLAYACIIEAYEVSDSAGEFWSFLRAVWYQASLGAPADTAEVDGWSDLYTTWKSAVQAASSAEDEEVANQLSSKLWGAVQLTAEDIEDLFGGLPNPDQWGGALAALAVLGVVVFAASR